MFHAEPRPRLVHPLAARIALAVVAFGFAVVAIVGLGLFTAAEVLGAHGNPLAPAGCAIVGGVALILYALTMREAGRERTP